MLKMFTGKRKGKIALAMAWILVFTSFVIPASAAGYSYTDGNYTGSGTGRGGKLSVTVTVSGSAISAIEIGDNQETPSYLEKAKGVIDKIILAQSTDVDMVSGATMSSRAIAEATEDALNQAYTGIFDSGRGTAASPYIIATAEQLKAFRDSVNGGETYKDQFIALGGDISLKDNRWVPINGFAGTFSGAGWTISGLTIGSPEAPEETTEAGLFATLADTAVIKNLGLTEVSIYASNAANMVYAGGLAAKTSTGTSGQGTVIDRCYVTGTVISSVTTVGKLSYAGGLTGYLGSYSSVTNCFTNISVNSKAGDTLSAYAGGLSAMAAGNTAVVNCYTLGEVTGTSANTNMGAVAGGLFGMSGGKSYNCYSFSGVTVNNVKDSSYQTTAYAPVGVLAGQVPGSGQMDTMYYAADTNVTINGVSQTPVPAVGKGSGNAEPVNLTGVSAKAADFKSLASALNNGLKSVNVTVPGGISFCEWEGSVSGAALSSRIYVNPDIGNNIFAGGEGTAEKPYLIATEEQLRAFAVSLNERIDYKGLYIQLANDIDVSSKDWIPVGEGEYSFCGTFDGAGHQISGLKYGSKEEPKNADGYVYIGLFGVISEKGLVKNLGLTGVGLYTTGENSVNTASIAGYLDLGGIDNCYAVGTVSGKTTTAGNNFAGGLVGNQYKGYIINSWSDVEVRSEAAGKYASEAGGLVSLNNRGLIANCYTLGNASGDAVRASEGMAYVSNLVACQAGTVVNCYVTGGVTADSYSYYVGAVSGMTTGIGKGFLSYYNKEAVQKIDSQVPNPFVAVGTTISTNEDGIISSGFNYKLEGFRLADMRSKGFAETLNNNFKSFPVDLSQWLPGDRTLKTWIFDESKNRVVPAGEDASITYVPVTVEDSSPASYKAGTYYGRAADDHDMMVSVTVTKDKMKEINMLSKKTNSAVYSAVIDAVLKAQSTGIDYDKGNVSVTRLLEAIDKALKKAAAGDTSAYGMADPAIFAGGNGTAEKPYKIANARQLAAFAASMNEDENYEGKYVILTDDISLAGVNWIPTGGGNGSYAFRGTFDGGGHTVSKMTIGSDIQPADFAFAGLFGYVNRAAIKNVKLTQVSINNHYTGEGRSYGGTLAAAIETGTCIDNCSAWGSISNQGKNMSYVGGLIGYTSGIASAASYITNCSTDVDVTAISDTSWIYAGGISGLNNRTYIVNCYTLGDTTGNSTNNMNKAAVGGIAGMQAGYVRNCYALGNTATLPASTDIGGYAGRHSGIAETYSAYYNAEASQYSGNTPLSPAQGVGAYTPSSTTGLVAAEKVESKSTNSMKSAEFALLLNGYLTDSKVTAGLPQNISLKTWTYDTVSGYVIHLGETADNSGGGTTSGGSASGGSGSGSTGNTTSGTIALNGFSGNAEFVIAKDGSQGRINAAISLPAGQILSQINAGGEGKPRELTIPIGSEELMKLLKEKEYQELVMTVTLPDSLRNNKAININLRLAKELLKTAGLEGKTVRASVADEKGRELYSWNFSSENLLKTDKIFKDVNLSLERRAIVKNSSTVDISDEAPKEISDGLAVHFFHDGILPAQAEVKIYVGDLADTGNQLKTGSRLYLYHRNKETGKLDTLPYGYGYTIDKDGCITINLVHCSDYVILAQKAGNRLITSLLNQVKVTPGKLLLYAGTSEGTTDISVKLPDTLELVKDGKDRTVSSAIGGVTVACRSSNTAVASVNSTGKITAKKAGTAKITTIVTLYSGKSKTVTTDITVKNPYLVFTSGPKSLKTGDSAVYAVKGYGVDIGKLEWSTVKKGIIVIDKVTGKAAAKSKGTDYVIARAGKTSIRVKVVVR